jgi:hypothetical protein
MKIRTALLTMTAALSLGAMQARACEFRPEDAQKDVDKADYIFTGGVTGTQHLSRESNNISTNPEFKTMFNADKFYKGRAGGAVNVIQMHDAWGHYVTFNTGKEYLVLASRNEYGLLIDGCSPVISLDPASARSSEPGPEYKAALAKALKDDSLFPSLAPVAQNEPATEEAVNVKAEAPVKHKVAKAVKKKPEMPADETVGGTDTEGAE